MPGVAGAGPPFFRLGIAGGEPGQGEHGQGDVGVPGPPGTDLVVIEPGLALGCWMHSSVCQRLPAVQARSAVLHRDGP
jgi:hypothetical protein